MKTFSLGFGHIINLHMEIVLLLLLGSHSVQFLLSAGKYVGSEGTRENNRFKTMVQK